MDKNTLKKDWIGNKKTTFSTLGASNHSDQDRALNDYYATDPACGSDLLRVYPAISNIWECAYGGGI